MSNCSETTNRTDKKEDASLSLELKSIWRLKAKRRHELLSQSIDKSLIEELDGLIKNLQSQIKNVLKELENPEIVLEKNIQTYAQKRKIPLLAAKARLFPVVDSQSCKQFEDELCDFLASLDIHEVMSSHDKIKINELIKLYKILFNEGYGDFLAIKSVMDRLGKSDQIAQKIKNWIEFKKEIINEELETFENVQAYIEKKLPELKKYLFLPKQILIGIVYAERERIPESTKEFVITKKGFLKNCYPEAKKIFSKLSKEEQEEMLKLAHVFIRVADFESADQEFFCESLTLFSQIIAYNKGIAPGEAILTNEHVSLLRHGLVLDCADFQIKSPREFALKVGYEEDERATQTLHRPFYQTKNGLWLPVCQDGKITGFHRAHGSNQKLSHYELISDVLQNEFSDTADIKKNLSIFRFTNMIDPFNYKSHNILAGHLEETGQIREAKDWYEMSFKINPCQPSLANLIKLLLQNNEDFTNEEEILSLCREHLTNFPCDAGVLYLFAQMQSKRHNTDESSLALFYSLAYQRNPEHLFEILKLHHFNMTLIKFVIRKNPKTLILGVRKALKQKILKFLGKN